MNDQAGLSVVIPLFNKCNSIAKTISSVLNQTYPNFEILIVDDGSTDGSVDIVSDIHDHRIKCIKQPNGGVSSARNRGIREAQYELIAFLDADDLWEPNYLEEMVRFIVDFPEAGMYGCAYDEIEEDVIIYRNFGLPSGFKGIVQNYFNHANKNHLFCSSAVVIRKQVTNNTGYFDERISLGEDLDYWFRIAVHNKVAFYNKVLAHYNTGATERAMMRKHPYNRSLLCYMDNYKEMERNNEDLRLFINLFKIRKIPELLGAYEISNKEINHYLSHIDITGQSLIHRIFLFMPLWMKRILLFIWKKYRGIET